MNEVASLPVNRKGIKLSDVADIRYGYPVKDSYQRLNGRNAVKVRVMKSSDANMVAVAREIINTVNGIKVDPRMKRLEIYVYRDRSEAILERLKSLRNAGLLGGVLVVVILFFFLRNVRSALIITAAIPISVSMYVLSDVSDEKVCRFRGDSEYYFTYGIDAGNRDDG